MGPRCCYVLWTSVKSPWPGGLHTSGSGEPCWFPAVLQETPTLSGVGIRPRDSVSVPPTRAAVPLLSIVPEVSALPLYPLLMVLEAGCLLLVKVPVLLFHTAVTLPLEKL